MYLSQAPPGLVQALDEAIRVDLQHSRDSYFWWLIASSAVLALGVILEGPEVIHETIGLFRRGSESERLTPAWIKVLALFGWILIAVGVAGEGIAEAFVSKADGVLQTFNDILLTDARKEAAFAIERAASAYERAALANERAERERKARTAMLLQLQPRDFTKKQMDDFVASIKGKVTDLNVFTLPDPEAAAYGFEVIDALQRAGVKVAWYPTTSPYFLIPGISSSGLTIYESPGSKVGIPLMEAFMKAGQNISRLTPEAPSDLDRPGLISLSSVPSPALFIALKQPAFMWLPGYRNSPALHAHRPPWDPK